MDEMLKCPHCQSLSQDQGHNFCPNCKGQVRCLNSECKSVIKTVAEICLFCGDEVKKLYKAEINTFELLEDYSETSSSRKIRVTATDIAVDKFAGTFFSLIQPNSQPKRPQNLFQPSIHRNLENVLQSPKQEKTIDTESPINQPEIEGVNLPSVTEIDENTQSQIAQSLFKNNDQDESLVVLDRLRDGKYGDSTGSKRWKARNLVLFFITAFEFYHQKLPNKKQIYEIVREEKLFDSNFRDDFTKYIAKQYLSLKGQDAYELHYSGRQQLLKAISAMMNPIEETSNTRKKGRNPGRSRGSSSKKDSEIVTSWIEKELNIDGFDTRLLVKAKNWALFTLHVLKSKLKVAESVKPGLAHLFAEKKFSSMTVSKKAFVNILASEKLMFSSNNSGEYFLTPEGEKAAENLLVKLL
jgi:hypothetical protein